VKYFFDGILLSVDGQGFFKCQILARNKAKIALTTGSDGHVQELESLCLAQLVEPGLVRIADINEGVVDGVLFRQLAFLD